MKTKPFGKILFSAMLFAAGAIVLNSCEDPVPEPVAGFDYVTDNLEVTFTNKSTDATTYAWDFGDGETSTEENPVHTYAAFGTYSVTLEATGESGVDMTTPEDIVVEKSSVVVIDGDQSEWADIDALVTYTDGEGGFLSELKVDYDATNLYIYLKGTEGLRGFIDVYINADADTATGADSWIYPAGLGAEYLLEGDLAIADGLDLFGDNPDTEDWCWDLSGNCGAPTPVVAQGSGLVNSGLLVSDGTMVEVEFSIVRALVPNLSSEKIGLGICDYSKVDDGDWGYYGSLPAIGTETSEAVMFEFN